MSGLGAGLDSFYEYLLKVIVLFSFFGTQILFITVFSTIGVVTAFSYLFAADKEVLFLPRFVCVLTG